MKTQTLIQLLLLSLFLGFFTKGFSQSHISGTAQETNGEALPFANVLLLNPSDSSLIKGTVSDENGKFVLENIKAGNYLLAITMVGYEQSYLKVNTSASNLDLGILKINTLSKELNEITVEAKKPLYEQQIDRLVINVANSIIAGGSTALEVLEKTPGVTVDRQNNSLQLQGKDGVIVEMDGKQSYLSMADLVMLLKTMPSDNIEQIELITNPSAKYSAAGNSGIINIRRKKNNNIGTNGSLSLGIGTGRYERERANMQLNHRSKKLNFFGNLSAGRGGNYFDLRTNRIINDGGQINLAEQNTYIRFRDRGQNANAGLDYFINKNTTLGLLWTGFWSNNGEVGTAESFFRRDETSETYLSASTDKTIASNLSNQIVNVNFQHSFGEKGGQLSADLDYGHFTRYFSNTLLTENVAEFAPVQVPSGLITEMPTTIQIRTARLDYNFPLFPDWKMETGLKSSYVYSDNDMTLSQGEANQLAEDPDLSIHFQYTERVYAAYASFAGKIGNKTQLQFGLRAEHTHSLSNSLTESNVLTRDYLNFFPSFFLSKTLSKNHSLNFSYSYRIDRPNYQNLNPARSYVDPYLYSRGNAYLKPQYTHSFELKHGFKDEFFTSLGASYIKDLMFYVIQPLDSIRTERTPLNFGEAQSYNLTLSFPLKVMKGWNVQANFIGLYSQFQYIFQDNPFKVQQISGQFNASNTFVFGHGWTAEATGWLKTPAVYSLNYSPWLASMDIGLQKSVRPNFQIKLSVQDLFHSNFIAGNIDTPNFKSKHKLYFDTRIVMLNFTYSFGNQQLKGVRQRKIGSEDENKRTN